MSGFIKNNIFFTAIIFICFLLFTSDVAAATKNISCPNRYLTLVNPVRGRNLWSDKTLNPLTQQYKDTEKYLFPVTWLLQYDAIRDSELIKEMSNFDSKDEEGVFLEVSKGLADDAKVAYPIYLRWSDPGAVFLSAYTQGDRRKLIDTVFNKYKEKFGHYPKSVGAWWIDSYSLEYMYKKYGIKTAMIVADQKVTDSYGVWGQWWGFAYKPSKVNILVPAASKNNLINVTVIQWAQRDPILAYGGVGTYSKYSLQANDYRTVGKDINYFESLAEDYLDCQNPLGQITVGLETGTESLAEPLEYQKQLRYLSEIPGLSAVTMSTFADKYSDIYETNPDKVVFGDNQNGWEMTKAYRKNTALGDLVNYDQGVSFPDFFVKDGSSFLNRVLPVSALNKAYGPWFLVVYIIFLAIFFKKHRFWGIGLPSVLFSLAAFGLVLRSGYQYGWQVFFGPQVKNLEIVQVLLVIFSFGVVWLSGKLLKKGLNLWFIPLSYGIDALVAPIRYTFISGFRYFGVLVDSTRFLGVKFNSFSAHFVSEVYPATQGSAFIGINFQKIWQNATLYFIVSPVIHLFIAVILWQIYKRLNKKFKLAFISLILFLFILYLTIIFMGDPSTVVAL